MSGKNPPYSNHKKKVAQYTLEGELIKIWDCGRDVEKYFGVGKGIISQATSGKVKTFKKFVWKRL